MGLPLFSNMLSQYSKFQRPPNMEIHKMEKTWDSELLSQVDSAQSDMTETWMVTVFETVKSTIAEMEKHLRPPPVDRQIYLIGCYTKYSKQEDWMKIKIFRFWENIPINFRICKILIACMCLWNKSLT